MPGCSGVSTLVAEAARMWNLIVVGAVLPSYTSCCWRCRQSSHFAEWRGHQRRSDSFILLWVCGSLMLLEHTHSGVYRLGLRQEGFPNVIRGGKSWCPWEILYVVETGHSAHSEWARLSHKRWPIPRPLSQPISCIVSVKSEKESPNHAVGLLLEETSPPG